MIPFEGAVKSVERALRFFCIVVIFRLAFNQTKTSLFLSNLFLKAEAFDIVDEPSRLFNARYPMICDFMGKTGSSSRALRQRIVNHSTPLK